MFARALRQDGRVSAAEFEVRTSCTITISEQVEDRNAAAEMLRGGRGIVARHVQHAIQTMRFTGETEVGRGIGRLFTDELKLASTIIELTSLQIGFGGDQPRLADRLTISDGFRKCECFSCFSQ